MKIGSAIAGYVSSREYALFRMSSSLPDRTAWTGTGYGRGRRGLVPETVEKTAAESGGICVKNAGGIGPGIGGK